jgi:3'(2'), 5'-bisphosphate nucleotidase
MPMALAGCATAAACAAAAPACGQLMDLQAARAAGVAAVRAAASITEAVRSALVAHAGAPPGSMQQTKADRSPVTVADFAAQAILVGLLRKTFPAVPVVAEENAEELRTEAGRSIRESVVELVRGCPGMEGTTEEGVLELIDGGTGSPPGPAPAQADGEGTAPPRYFWCIDPIDGTKGFLRNDQYAICLGLVEVAADGWGSAVVGVLGCPQLPLAVDATGGYVEAADAQGGTIMHAARGGGAVSEELHARAAGGPVCRAQQPLSVNSGYHISSDAAAASAEQQEAVAATGATGGVCCVESVEPTHTDQAANAALCAAVGITRPPLRMDSQCKYAVVARGDAGLYLRMAAGGNGKQNIWDHAAGAVIVAEAGGCTTDSRGMALDFGAGRQLTANAAGLVTSAGGGLHSQVIGAIATAAAAAAPPAAGAGADTHSIESGGLQLSPVSSEADVQGAAVLLCLCDLEFAFPGSARSSWAQRVKAAADGVRSYLPPAGLPPGRGERTVSILGSVHIGCDLPMSRLFLSSN